MFTPWKKCYDQPRQHIKKQRHHFADKHPYNQSYVFSSSHVRLWKLDIKKTEGHRTDAFELWCWRRLLRVPQTARRSNQSILKEINPEYSLEGLMLKLKLQYLGYLMQRTDSFERPWCWERLKMGWEEDDRGWDGWMASLSQGTWVWASSGCWWWTGRPGVLQSKGSPRVGHDWVTELNWTELRRAVIGIAKHEHGWQPGPLIGLWSSGRRCSLVRQHSLWALMLSPGQWCQNLPIWWRRTKATIFGLLTSLGIIWSVVKK